MTLRAKFTCESITKYVYNDQVKLRALYSNTKEDNQFSEATPGGELSMTITVNKDFFKVGKAYYMDFTEVES